MSYDIYLRCNTCKQSADDRLSPTYNLGGVFRHALQLPSFKSLNGMTGKESAPYLETASHRLIDPKLQSEFEALAPSNGWGTVDGARRVIQTMRELAERCPESVWDIG